MRRWIAYPGTPVAFSRVPFQSEHLLIVETTAGPHGIPHPRQTTVAVTHGVHVWTFGYSAEGRSRSLYVGTDVGALRALHRFRPEYAGAPGAWR